MEEEKSLNECLAMSTKIDIESERENDNEVNPKTLILKEFDKVVIEQYLKVFVKHPKGFSYFLKTNQLEVIISTFIKISF